MFWLAKFFTKGKTVQEGIEQFVRFNKRQPDKLEIIKIKNAFMEANRPTNVIQFPKERITDWTKPRPTKGPHKADVEEKHWKDIVDVDEREMRMADPKFDAKMSLSDKHSKELEALTPDKHPGMSFFHEMHTLMKRHDKERLQLDYDEFFEKLLEKAKIVDTDPKVLLQAEFGKKLTGKETADQLLELFKNRTKKAYGGIAGMLGERTGFQVGGESLGEQKSFEDMDSLKRSHIGNGFYDIPANRGLGLQPLPSSPGADNQLNVTAPEIPVAMQQPMSGGAGDKTQSYLDFKKASGLGGLGGLKNDYLSSQPNQQITEIPPGGQPSTTMNTTDWNTAHGGAFKGLDMTGFKPTITHQQDMANFSINGNEVQGMNSAYAGSVREFLNSTGQGDAFSGYSGLTPIPSSPGGGMQSQGPRVLGIGGQRLATGGIANHFRAR